MSGTVLVAPSILSADFSRLGEEIRKSAEAGADWIHVDVMDGVFVPNITIGPCVVKSARKSASIPFDCHLMIQKPENFIKQFSDAGADIITFHLEACKDPAASVKAIKAAGKKAGVSIKPGTDAKELSGLLKMVDLVLIMTVEPGFGGQSFMKEMLPKIKELRRVFGGYIEVDGGINSETARLVVDAGANVLVAGTAVFGENDYAQAIRRLKGE